MKGAIKSNHNAVNKYRMSVVGLPSLTPTKISGLEVELEVVDLPDRTVASGGNTKAIEFTAMFPMHHTLEIAALDKWLADSTDPVQPGYKKAATITVYRIGPGIPNTTQLIGVFPCKRKSPDLEMVNEGEMAEIEYTFKVDQTI